LSRRAQLVSRAVEFVYHREDVLAVYQPPPDPQRPVVCLDETFQPLIGAVRDPLSAQPGAVARYDSVSVRNGVASVFLAFEPWAGWRQVRITETRRRTEGACFVESLLEERYREAERVVLVMDQLNTHSPASLYEAFAPDKAQRWADRLEIHDTTQHGSWLNRAEIELSVLRRDWPERVGDRSALDQHVAARQARRNQQGVTAEWQFTTTEARMKLRKLYPTIEG
jgi:DDE superfamily endonuclease